MSLARQAGPFEAAAVTSATRQQRATRCAATLAGIIVLAFIFAQVEIQIEGADGWAAKLPTWRMAPNLFLKIFWGGREMTGYHAWVFPFVALVFHYPMLHSWRWTWRLQARALAAPMIFWIVEDALWFVMNPAFGLARLKPGAVSWHPHWVLGLPVDYWVFSVVGMALLWWSFGEPSELASPSR